MTHNGAGSDFGERDEATAGTPVITADGRRAGVVSGVLGKYIHVTPDVGDEYWLSVTAIQKADSAQVTLNFDGQALPEWALAEPNGADAADPRIDEQADSLTSDAGKVARRESLVH